jgi:outer membrane protein OmpA-like peptidoglycan-associated protein/Mg-chelatase subunit ChlD
VPPGFFQKPLFFTYKKREIAMRNIYMTTMLLLLCIFTSAWATDVEPDVFSVKGPDNAQRLSFQEIEEGKMLVSVTDQEEKPIIGLTIEDFSILKGTRKAKVVSVEPLETSKDVGLNIVLVVDNSASMRDRKAVQPLLEALESFYNIIRPIDNISIIVYDDYKSIQINDQKLHAKILQSKDVGQLRALVKKQMTKELTGGTYLYDAMMAGLDQVRKFPEKSNKFMVVFTDGEDLNSSIKDEAVMKAAKNIPNFGAYTVDYMPAESVNSFLKAFAQDNNGHVWKASSAEELMPIFAQFSSTLLHRYIVSYRFLNAPVGDIAFEPQAITIEEISTIDSAPLLNYLFFETAQSELSQRYIQLKDQADTDTFSETALTSVMEKHCHLLNIIGHRMRKYQDAVITLVGCNSNTGDERARKDLSRSRAESVRAYLRYVWGISADRMSIEDRNLPEAPSTNRIAEGQVENQRVEIRSDHADILDTVKSEYVEKVSDVQQITFIPKVTAEAGVQDWKVTLRSGDTIIGAFKGVGEMAPSYVLPLEKTHLDKLAITGAITASLQVTDKESKQLVLDDAGRLPVKFIKRKEQLAQKQGYKVREKYALILFDYDSAAIKARNKTIVDRIITRMKDVPQASVDIVGHTDNIGKEDYNVNLSERRAEAVKAQFDQIQDITLAGNMTMSGDGPHNPLYDNAAPEGRALNRTVTIALEYEMQ